MRTTTRRDRERQKTAHRTRCTWPRAWGRPFAVVQVASSPGCPGNGRALPSPSSGSARRGGHRWSHGLAARPRRNTIERPPRSGTPATAILRRPRTHLAQTAGTVPHGVCPENRPLAPGRYRRLRPGESAASRDPTAPADLPPEPPSPAQSVSTGQPARRSRASRFTPTPDDRSAPTRSRPALCEAGGRLPGLAVATLSPRHNLAPAPLRPGPGEVPESACIPGYGTPETEGHGRPPAWGGR